MGVKPIQDTQAGTMNSLHLFYYSLMNTMRWRALEALRAL